MFHSRVSILVIVIGVFLLALMPQGREVGLSVSEKLYGLSFLIAVAACSFYCWFWSRTILNLEFQNPQFEAFANDDVDRKMVSNLSIDELRWVRWLPRILGALPPLAATYAIFVVRNHAHDEGQDNAMFWLIASGALTIGLLFLYSTRRTIGKLLVKLEFISSSQRSEESGAHLPLKDGRFSSLPLRTKILILAGILVPGVVFLYGIYAPQWVGQFFGAGAVVFWFGVLLVSLFSAAIFFFGTVRQAHGQNDGGPKPTGHEYWHFPVISISILLGGLLTLALIYTSGQYAVRPLKGTDDRLSNSWDQRVEIQKAIEAWSTKNQVCEAGGTRKAVIVATAGGALRAAHWTGAILGKLHDDVELFEDQLFAASSVSGGALGTVAYMAALRENPPKGQTRDRISRGLDGDFLGPVFVGMLSNDVLLKWSKWFGGANRADALEMGWERTWQRSSESKGPLNPMAQNFFELWPDLGQRPWPLLFLNGTHMETGRRIITSNAKTEGAFHQAHDFFNLFGRPVAASTAAHNSARFSYISPAGLLTQKTGASTGVGHIIDGGYFENYGAETAIEIYNALTSAKLCEDTANGKSLEVIVVQIVSDPEISRSAFDRVTSAGNEGHCVVRGIAETPREDRSSNQYLGPLQGLLSARQSRGLHAAKRLACLAGQQNYYLFNMSFENEARKPTLSWYLAPATRKSIDDLIDDPDSSEHTVMACLIARLNGQAKPHPGCPHTR